MASSHTSLVQVFLLRVIEGGQRVGAGLVVEIVPRSPAERVAVDKGDLQPEMQRDLVGERKGILADFLPVGLSLSLAIFGAAEDTVQRYQPRMPLVVSAAEPS